MMLTLRPGLVLSKHCRAFSSTSAVKDVTLQGYYPRESPNSLVLNMEWVFKKSLLGFIKWCFSSEGMRTMSLTLKALKMGTPEVQMHDARQLEAEQGLSKIDFFNKYGFVLIDSKVSLTAEDWLASDGMKYQSDII